MISSLIANCAILFDTAAESTHTNGLGSIRIRPVLMAQAVAASAVIGCKPAIRPIPTADPEGCSVFIFLSGSLPSAQSTREVPDVKRNGLHPALRAPPFSDFVEFPSFPKYSPNTCETPLGRE